MGTDQYQRPPAPLLPAPRTPPTSSCRCFREADPSIGGPAPRRSAPPTCRRLHAAKHIAPGDLAKILLGLPPQTLIIDEVLRGDLEPIKREDYVSIGRGQDAAAMHIRAELS